MSLLNLAPQNGNDSKFWANWLNTRWKSGSNQTNRAFQTINVVYKKANVWSSVLISSLEITNEHFAVFNPTFSNLRRILYEMLVHVEDHVFIFDWFSQSPTRSEGGQNKS